MNEQGDGALPVSVDYRVFRQMYSKLHTGIEAGVSDVVSKVFSEGLITPHTKSVAENLSVAAPSRVSTLLDAVLQRIKTNYETFDIFADVLESIDSLLYLATEMRMLRAQETEEERKRMEYLQKQKNLQIEKRKSLQLSVDPSDPPMRKSVPITDSSDPMRTVRQVKPDSSPLPSISSSPRLETNSPSPVYSTMRDILATPINSPVRVVTKGISPIKFNGSATPSLGPSSLSSSTFSSMPSLTERSQSAIALQSLTMHQEEVIVKQNVVAVVTKATTVPMTESAMVAPATTTSSNSESDSFNSDTREDSSVSLPLDSVPVKNLSHEESTEDESDITTNFLSTPPKMMTTAPTPDTSIQTLGVQPSDSDDDEITTVVALKPSGSFQNLRTNSVESSCSYDFYSAPTSLAEDEANVSQESEDTHCTGSLVGGKLHRSISCEKCATEKLKEAERRIAELQLETSQLQAVYESNTKKLLRESAGLQSELYELNLSLQKHRMANEEVQRHCEEQSYANFRLEAENRQLRDQIKLVKANAYDRMMALENERSKTHQCPNCHTEFYYPSTS